ncbi:hypothetical protein LEMLEM_LOCUS1871, partial [Lemmus lemmus]
MSEGKRILCGGGYMTRAHSALQVYGAHIIDKAEPCWLMEVHRTHIIIRLN